MKRMVNRTRWVAKQTAEPMAQRPGPGTRHDLQPAELAQVVGGDVYIMNPRGSNNRENGG